MTTFFIAESNMGTLMKSEVEIFLDNFLFAVNYLNKTGIAYVEKLIGLKKNVLIDSGVFALASDYSRKTGIPISDAITRDPESMDGFKDLFGRYVEIIKRFEKDLWGYIELDLGGQENKIRIRGELEKLGLKPIPVYHPLNDDYSYFDHLCENYNRIAIGNLVSVNNKNKRKILWDINKRRAKYPGVRIHFLGFSMSADCFNIRVDSCDSSEFSGVFRWATVRSKILLKNFAYLERRVFKNKEQVERFKVARISALETASNLINYQNYSKEINVYQ